MKTFVTSRQRSTIFLLATLSALAGGFIFWPGVHNQMLMWDDIMAYVGPASQMRGLSLDSLLWAFTNSIHIGGYYHPLTWISFLLDYSLWGLQPLPYHVTSLLLHFLNTFLVILYLEKLLATIDRFSSVQRYIVAFTTGMVFAVHPLQAETVLWIAERKTLLCTVFIIVNLYAQVLLSEQPTSRIWRTVMHVGFVLALLSKPMAIPLPGILLVLDWYPLRRNQTIGWRNLIKEKAPMFVLSVLAAASTLITQTQQGAVNTTLGIRERMWMIPRNLVFYVWKMIWPAWLSPFYPTSPIVPAWNPEFLVPVAVCAAVVVLAISCRRRFPALLAVLIVYGLLIAPVSGVVPLGGYAVADRYAYLPLMPWFLLAAGAGVLLWRRLGRIGRVALTALTVGQLTFYAYAARSQIKIWHDDETLWSVVLSHFPNSAIANCQLAAAYIDRGRFEEAYQFAWRSIHLSPSSFPEALAIVGVIDLKRHRYDDAVKELTEATDLRPDLLTAHYNLACALTRVGRLAGAFELLSQLIREHPEYTRLAARDKELAALRNDPRYGARFAEMVAAAQEQ